MRLSLAPLTLLAAALTVVVDCRQVRDVGPALAALAEGPSAAAAPRATRAARLMGGQVEIVGMRASQLLVRRRTERLVVSRKNSGGAGGAASPPREEDDRLWGVTAPPEPPADADDPELASDEDDMAVGGERHGAARAPTTRDLLVSVARETWVMAEPRWHSRRLGYLRAGSSVPRSAHAAGRRGCRHGWYAVEPRGYVCVGRTASLDQDNPVARLFSVRPVMDGLPYLYAMSRLPPAPIYARLPSPAEQQRVEPRLQYWQRSAARRRQRPGFRAWPAADAIPASLLGGQPLPGLGGAHHGAATVLLGRALPRSGFALLGTYQHQGRRFGLTTDLGLIPLDRVQLVQPSTLKGVRLSDEFTLPVAMVRSRYARRYLAQPSGALAIAGQLPWRTAIALSGRRVRRGGQHYLEARDGSFVRADKVIEIKRFVRAPAWAKRGRKWIDVSILRQALVAYQGTVPIYATIVSTGADGIADAEDSHATIQGTFLIHTKHISVTMDGDERGDAFDLRDVPFVQYFTEGYALHAAYWHDDFGRPRSHGCVNLAPADAAWLFGWTEPAVPTGWHAALSLHHGTVVHIHP